MRSGASTAAPGTSRHAQGSDAHAYFRRAPGVRRHGKTARGRTAGRRAGARRCGPPRSAGSRHLPERHSVQHWALRLRAGEPPRTRHVTHHLCAGCREELRPTCAARDVARRGWPAAILLLFLARFPSRAARSSLAGSPFRCGGPSGRLVCDPLLLSRPELGGAPRSAPHARPDPCLGR